MDSKAAAPKKIIGNEGLSEKINLGRSSIYARLDPKSPQYDPTFPKPFKLGNSTMACFLESEVDAWLDAQIQRSRAASQAA